MSNGQFVAVVGAVIISLIGTLLFERYADCQAKGGSLIMRPRSLQCAGVGVVTVRSPWSAFAKTVSAFPAAGM
jgi:hypothetical protein